MFILSRSRSHPFMISVPRHDCATSSCTASWRCCLRARNDKEIHERKPCRILYFAHFVCSTRTKQAYIIVRTTRIVTLFLCARSLHILRITYSRYSTQALAPYFRTFTYVPHSQLYYNHTQPSKIKKRIKK